MDVKCEVCNCIFKAPQEQIKIFEKELKWVQEETIWLCKLHWCDCLNTGHLPLKYAYQCFTCKKNYYCMRCGVFTGGDKSYLGSKGCVDCE